MLRAPFPWFGGKSRAASLIWSRLGDVKNYVEPFAGSMAVLLARESAGPVETVNDLDGYVSNFWRALKADPAAVERYTQWPVSEADLHARHVWLLAQSDFRERMLTDPDFYDAKVAGWWVWGLSCWIGSGWCESRTNERTNERTNVSRRLPRLTGEQGVRAGRFQNSTRRAASSEKNTGPHHAARSLQGRTDGRTDGNPSRRLPAIADDGRGIRTMRARGSL